MPHATKLALFLAIGIHVALACAVKLIKVPPPSKATESYVEVALYDPPTVSIPAAPTPPEPPPTEPSPPEPEPAPTLPPVSPPPEMIPEPVTEQPAPVPEIPKPAPPEPTPSPKPKTTEKKLAAQPKTKSTAPQQKPSNQAGGGNSTYQAVNSVTFLNRRTPTYPAEALRNKQTGRVVLLLYISEFGTVDRVETVSSSGISSLDAAAVNAAKKSTFRPAVSGGKPVKSKAKVPFNFQIK